MRTPRRKPDASSFFRTPVSIAVAMAFAQGASAATYMVTNANETGAGSFYQAVTDANAACVAGTDTAPVIQFSGPFVIAPSSVLPIFSCYPAANPYNPTIDGWLTPGAVSNTDTTGFNATLPVVFDMGSFVYGNKCVLEYDSNGYGGSLTVKGMEVRNYTYGGFGACGVINLQGNRFNNVGTGAQLVDGSRVGSPATADRNVMVNNTNAAIRIQGGNVTIVNNLLGTPDGFAPAPNYSGIFADSSCCQTMSGSISSNIIVANGNAAILLVGDTMTIDRNKINTDVSGAYMLGNSAYGISLNYSYGSSITNNVVASSSTGIRVGGDLVFGGGQGNAYIANNVIGDTVGNSELGNTVGIHLSFTYGARVDSNVISGNTDTAVHLDNASNATVSNNIIGTNAAGTTAFGNGFGIFVGNGSVNNTITSNRVSANRVGIALADVGVNSVRGNTIGSTSSAALGNDYGVWIDCSSNIDFSGNSVSANHYGGIQGGAVQLSNFADNQIGSPIGNGGTGMEMFGESCSGGAAALSAMKSGRARVAAADKPKVSSIVLGAMNDSDSNVFHDNTVMNNTGHGLWIQGGNNNSVLYGRYQGNSLDGIRIESRYDAYGAVLSAATGNSILQMQISGNRGKNINLGFDGGPLPNDPGDTDTGKPNNWQNRPVITSVTRDTTAKSTTVNYSLDSLAGNYEIDFFSNSAPGKPSGETWITSTTLAIAAAGVTSGSYTFSGTTWDNISATATRTDATAPADTSEFADIVAVSALPVPGVNVTPSMVNFGDVVVGRASPSSPVSITSTGTADYVIYSLRENTCGGAPICSTGAFICSTTCVENSPYRPGTSCTISASFAPTTAGPQSKTLALCDNTVNSSIVFTGNGVPPPVVDISYTPSFGSFGEVLVGLQSAPRSFTLSNAGANQVYLGAPSTTGDFVITGNTCAATLAAGASCSTDVTFSPATKGGQNGKLQITGSTTPVAAAQRTKVASTSTTVASALLQGSGVQFGDLRLPASLSFGTLVLHREIAKLALPLTNTGNGALAISSISVAGPFTMTNDCGTSLAVGASCSIQLSFNPTTLGTFNGTLTIISDAPGGSRAIALDAQVIAEARPVVRVDPVNVGFGARLIGSTSPASRVVITNDGAQTADLGAMTFVQPETGKPEYSIAGTNCPTSLSPQANCFVDLVLKPLGFGSRNGQFIVPSNSADSPRTVNLSGTGCRPFSAGTNRAPRDPCSP